MKAEVREGPRDPVRSGAVGREAGHEKCTWLLFKLRRSHCRFLATRSGLRFYNTVWLLRGKRMGGGGSRDVGWRGRRGET